jgi:peptidoglycan/xylan/chitin deacetylase (PgdA/CDA1 family)
MNRRNFLRMLGGAALVTAMPSVLSADEDIAVQENALEVPVLMYHAVNGQDSQYSRGPSRFRRDLEYLFEQGYKLTTMEELVSGSFRADKPVIITFDDARPSQFRLDENGNIDSNCAVGIMEEFCNLHDDFGKTAMFYVSFSANAPFGQRSSVGYKLNWLLDNGYELGNHTMWHDNLANVSFERMKESISRCHDEFEKHIGERVSLVKSFCFPYCAVPYKEEAWDYLGENFTSATIGGRSSYTPGDDLFKIPRYGILRTSTIENLI